MWGGICYRCQLVWRHSAIQKQLCAFITESVFQYIYKSSIYTVIYEEDFVAINFTFVMWVVFWWDLYFQFTHIRQGNSDIGATATKQRCMWGTVYPKKYAHGFWFAVLCCGYTLTDFPISIRLTSLALWQSNDCPSASKATLMNMDKYFMWIHYERLRNHNKAKHNKTVCIFLGIYCYSSGLRPIWYWCITQ